MHSPGSVHHEKSSRSFPECVELLDVSHPVTASLSPSEEQSHIGSPGAMRYQRSRSSDEFENMVALFEKKVGYMPHFTSNENRTELVATMHRSIWYAEIEKWINMLVMGVILLDTALLVYEFYSEKAHQPLWVMLLNCIFLFVYVIEVGFRLHIANPTFAFFKKRFYVLDLLIVVMCVVLQVASTMSEFAGAIRAIRLIRIVRVAKLLKLLRVFTRVLEIWHECNKRRIKALEATSLHINLRMKVDNSKLKELLARKKWLGSVKMIDKGRVELSAGEKELNIQELWKIVKLLKEEEDKCLFNWTEFSMEWLMLLTLWLGIVLALSWLFLILEFDNYEKVIQENRELKSLVDNSLPVRNQVPNVLTALAKCHENLTNETYKSLDFVYREYNSANRTLWDDLERIQGSYTFTNPWTFAGASFFTISVVTTIGYGSFTPLTGNGQLVVIFCSLPAIYLTIIFGRKNIYMFKAGLCKTQYESIGMIVFFSIVLLVVFMLIGGYVLSKHEGWTWLESIYFCWVSSSTIGFGDYAPDVGEHLNITYLALVIVGWHVIAFVISAMEVTLAAMKQLDWWSENYLLPPGSTITALPKRTSIKNSLSERFYGVAQVIKETKGNPVIEMEASLLLTPTRKKRKFTLKEK